MKSRTPLRELNEPSGFMGLSMADLCFVGYSLVAAHQILESYGWGFLAIPIAALEAFALSTVRLKFRTKILRDLVRRLFGPRRLYDAASRKN